MRIFLLSLLLVSVSGISDAVDSLTSPKLTLTEVARGHSWVSPYWGYSTPKIVGDGTSYYTAGLWGTYGEAKGLLYHYRDGAWKPGMELPGIYQPATLALDDAGRLHVVYTEAAKPVRILRAKTAGNVEDFETLPTPPDMTQAYYVGIAVHGKHFYIASIHGQSYTMSLARLNLETLEWRPSIVLQEGKNERKPKTAWTYPVLLADDKGVHILASNAPDGGDGNTYNRVCYLYYPNDAREPAHREIVAESPVGHNAYGLDMEVDAAGGVHVLHMWNYYVYGDLLPETAPDSGTYHAWRNPETGIWLRQRLVAVSIAGFYRTDSSLWAVLQEGGALKIRQWQPDTQDWSLAETLLEPSQLPVPLGFMDVVKFSGHGDASPALAVVGDGLLPVAADGRQERIVWSLLQEATESE